MLSIVGVSALAVASALTFQELTVPTKPTCSSCRLTLQHVAQLGPGAGAASPKLNAQVLRLADGSFLVNRTYTTGTIARYSAAGQLLGTWGRAGDGPGEFQYITRLGVLGHDTVLAADLSHRRITGLDSQGNLLFSRQLEIFPMNMAVGEDGLAMVIAGMPSDPEGVTNSRPAFSLVSFRTGGSHAGGKQSEYGNSASVTTSEQGGFWLNYGPLYQIQRYSATGQLAQTLLRPGLNAPALWAKRKSAPMIKDIREVDGILWVISTVLDFDKAPRRAKPKPGDPERKPEPVNALESYAYTLWEGIDPETGKLLVKGRSETRMQGFADDHHVYSYRELPTGVVVADVWRVVLRGPAGDRR